MTPKPMGSAALPEFLLHMSNHLPGISSRR